jgi:hypothetical protein
MSIFPFNVLLSVKHLLMFITQDRHSRKTSPTGMSKHMIVLAECTYTDALGILGSHYQHAKRQCHVRKATRSASRSVIGPYHRSLRASILVTKHRNWAVKRKVITWLNHSQTKVHRFVIFTTSTSNCLER